MIGRAHLLAVAVAGVMIVGGCGDDPSEPSGDDPTAVPCPDDARTTLLDADLVELEPSDPLDLPSGATAWIRVTKRPTAAGGLLGEIGGVAELHLVAAGAVPAITTTDDGTRRSSDPSVVVRRALEWQRLELPGGGPWRLYSLSNPGVEVIACE